jgi:hypothetical protein
MDEYADMKPEVWEQILRPALADKKGVMRYLLAHLWVVTIFTSYIQYATVAQTILTV